ncbi:MAG: chemotaxis protein CheA [Vampirovibrionales bacterium]
MMMMASIDDDALIQEFITESQEHLCNIEPDLLAMESQAPEVDQHIVNSIFRAIHSIKGAAGFFGFENLKKVSHVMESVLMRMRDKELTPQSYIVEPLLIGVDRLREMLDDVSQSETLDCTALSAELHYYTLHDTQYQATGTTLSTTTTPTGSIATPTVTNTQNEPSTISNHLALGFEVDLTQAQKAKNSGQHFFLLTLNAGKDLFDRHREYLDVETTAKSLGTFLGSNVPAADHDTPPETIQLLTATVLEQDLLAGAYDVAPEAIQSYTLDLASNTSTLADKLKEGTLQVALPAAPFTPSVTVVEQSNTPASTTNTAKAPEAKAPPAGGANSDAGAETIRVRVDLLNKLMDFAGELVLTRNQLMRTVGNTVEVDQNELGIGRIVQSIDVVTSSLQEHIMQTRMQPIEAVSRRFPRVVRDLANQLGKKITFEMVGQEVELDKSILESLSDPLTHMIRNCCDHGIETPNERQANGKAAAGTIRLYAYHEGGQINLEIKDDGKGIDTQRVGNKAISLGLITQAQFDAMSHQERLNLIFHPGLSTAEKVSDVSGRGVGMDVVRANIEKMGGHIHLQSTFGQGSTITLQLPLTLAIIPSLVVGCSNYRFAIPQVNLLELVRIRADEIHTKIERAGRANVLRLRGQLLPLLKLSDVLQLEPSIFKHPETGQLQVNQRSSIGDVRFEDPAQVEQLPDVKRQHPNSDYNVLVLRLGNNQYGLIVDKVFDTEEIVVKPLSKYIKGCKCFSGTTIMGDGSVAMICDVAGIANYAKLHFSEVKAEEDRRKALAAKRLEQSELESNGNRFKEAVILFSNHENEQFALPLHSVLRLEKIQLNELEVVGSREFVNYRGASLPLIRLEDYLSVRSADSQATEAFMIVPNVAGGKAGIYASKILDTLEVELQLDTHLIGETQVQGSAVINDHLTVFLNVNELLQSAGVWLEAEDYLAV